MEGRVSTGGLEGTNREMSLLAMAPLLKSDIKGMTGDVCLQMIQRRYGFDEDALLTKSYKTPRLWTREELARLALFNCEGVSTTEIADYFSLKFAEVVENSDYALSDETVRTVYKQEISGDFKKFARKRRAYLQTLGGRSTEDKKINETLLGIEAVTGLSRDEFLLSRGITERGAFTPGQVAMAFLLRIRDKLSYDEIFRHIRVITDTHNSERMKNLLSQQFNLFFSEEARAFLPYSKSRRTS